MQQGTEEHAMQGTRKSKFLFLIKFNQVREVNVPAKCQLPAKQRQKVRYYTNPEETLKWKAILVNLEE